MPHKVITGSGIHRIGVGFFGYNIQSAEHGIDVGGIPGK
jgi:hypothetical protein